VNQNLCRFISNQHWESKEAKKMDFYQKVELANPSSLLLESSLLELLYEVQIALTPPTSEKDGFI
jgi:hypothetical protein